MTHKNKSGLDKKNILDFVDQPLGIYDNPEMGKSAFYADSDCQHDGRRGIAA
jgi:hypothetical protein